MAVPLGVGDASDGFARFHDAYARRVRGLARHLLGSDPAVDDVVQETLWRAYRKGLHHDDRDPWPWLATVARNACHDVHRSRRATGELDEDLPLTDDPESAAVDAARRERVVDTLERLPERQRRLLLLRHVEGVGCEALASDEGSSVDAVKSALARARTAFRSCYDGWRGLVPWGVGPVVTRIRNAIAASSRLHATPRSGLAGGLAALFALGLLGPPGVTGSDAAEPPEHGAPPEQAAPHAAAAFPYVPIVESSPADTPADTPPTSQPEGGKRVASPPPTRRDARPAPGPVLEPSESSDDESEDLVELVDPDDLPEADDVVSTTEEVVETGVATVSETVDELSESVDEVSEPVDDADDDLTSTLL